MATKARNRLIHHCFGVVWIGFSTTPAIFSVTVKLLNPGAMIWSGPGSMTFGSSSSVFRLGIADLRVGVAQASQIGGSGPHVQVFEQAVIARLSFELRDAALGIVDVAENDGLSGTRLGAGWCDFAVGDAPVLLLGFYLGGIDALDAVSALLHHASAADRHIGITHAVQALRFEIRIQQEIEAAYLIRAVVRTIARAHAAVVNHLINAVAAMHRRGNRADQLTRCVLALHARHRLIVELGVVPIAFEVSVHAQPVHM